MKTLTFISKSEEQTVAFAKKIAKKADFGDVFLLNGTLGVGKSVFARAFIKELCGENQEVPSPTFTLVQMYDYKDSYIWHFDLYRIKEADEVVNLGIDDAFAEGVSLIEWAEKLENYTPINAIDVDIEQTDDTKRKITVKTTDFEFGRKIQELKNEVKG